MGKVYKSLKELIEEDGVLSAVKYKFLEMREKNKSFNRICSYGILLHTDCTAYNRSYIASWNAQGILIHFNPTPNYPEDFKPIKLECDCSE
jgi:hypothetical protein